LFDYSMVQMVRAYSDKLEKSLCEEIINLYQPFKRIPCFLHKRLEGYIKKRRKLSVIIEFHEDSYEKGCQEVRGVIKQHSKNGIKKDFPRVSCCSAHVTPNGLEAMLANCQHIRRVHLNREVKALLDVAVPSANAKKVVRNNKTLTGNDVTIAIIDTGIYPHRDLGSGKRIIKFVDFINNRTKPYDDNGHGTHCAGDAAGDGTASSGKYTGPAPKANLIGVKVLDKMGSGTLETIMQGIEWCIQYNEGNPAHKIDIISMSLGSTAQHYSNENEDPMVKMVEQAWNAGIVVCAAAGNEGPGPRTISSPGISDKVITVGALDDKDTANTRTDDNVASFSSRGPTIYGVSKPDILAPGVNIISLRSPNSYLDRTQSGNRVGKDYFVLSGTSMATPICAGVVALIKQQAPNATPQQVKDWLKAGADLWRGKDGNTYGAGYINAERSIPR